VWGGGEKEAFKINCILREKGGFDTIRRIMEKN